jgi:hypothetical protein
VTIHRHIKAINECAIDRIWKKPIEEFPKKEQLPVLIERQRFWRSITRRQSLHRSRAPGNETVALTSGLAGLGQLSESPGPASPTPAGTF